LDVKKRKKSVHRERPKMAHVDTGKDIVLELKKATKWM
jgi:hypothetical protein